MAVLYGGGARPFSGSRSERERGREERPVDPSANVPSDQETDRFRLCLLKVPLPSLGSRVIRSLRTFKVQLQSLLSHKSQSL